MDFTKATVTGCETPLTAISLSGCGDVLYEVVSLQGDEVSGLRGAGWFNERPGAA